MKLLKVILFFVIIYYIRRFILMYKAMQVAQQQDALRRKAEDELRAREAHAGPTSAKDKTIEADFKVIDR